MDPSSEEQVS